MSSVPGNLPTDAYDAILPPWRAAVRRALLLTVRPESHIIAALQNKLRSPWLDAYFVYSSSLGTHTFFMTFLPALYFFGYDQLGRGLLFQLAAGVYFSSVIKDLFCSPRPFSPPVTRLTIGSHHLEYGFPSTHSTNSVSMGLFFFSHIYDLAYPPTSTPSISQTTFTILSILLLIYTFSIVFGRIYTAMHSFTDCFTGVLLGSLIWWLSSSFRGIQISIPIPSSLSSPLDTTTLNFTFAKGLNLYNILWNRLTTSTSTYTTPLILTSLIILLVNQHPQPVDDCPCFEDAIAFASVVFGIFIGRWIVIRFQLPSTTIIGTGTDKVKGLIMPGSGWIFNGVAGEWIQIDRNWMDIGIWWVCALLKMIIGIITIFTWRLLTKSLLHLILPPTFRTLSKLIKLPNRRFYTPATKYNHVPSEFQVDLDESEGGGGGMVGVKVLHPIPSLIDLSVLSDDHHGIGIGDGEGNWGRGEYVVAKGSAVQVKGRGNVRKSGLRNVVAGTNGEEKKKRGVFIKLNEDESGYEYEYDGDEKERERDKDGELVKHYDADVLTKVIVYAGIAILAAEVLPIIFQVVGLGVRSSPPPPSSLF